MTVTVITPTCDRPVGFALTEHWMHRQTSQPDEWIVADGGSTPVRCLHGQVHLWNPVPPGPANFAANLSAALDRATSDVIVFFEDDDWYAPTHIEQLLVQLRTATTLIAGDAQQRYYHLPTRCWRVYANKGACLSQTGLHKSVIPLCRRAIREAAQAGSYGIDGRLWASLPLDNWNLRPTSTVVGLKGLPGQPGLGVGHRPVLRDPKWKRDPHFNQLRLWLGADADVYLRVMQMTP